MPQWRRRRLVLPPRARVLCPRVAAPGVDAGQRVPLGEDVQQQAEHAGHGPSLCAVLQPLARLVHEDLQVIHIAPGVFWQPLVVLRKVGRGLGLSLKHPVVRHPCNALDIEPGVMAAVLEGDKVMPRVLVELRRFELHQVAVRQRPHRAAVHPVHPEHHLAEPLALHDIIGCGLLTGPAGVVGHAALADKVHALCNLARVK
mmetsp:Transcript_8087/g.24576  ORF Transcript_8087/g.24576 Transcript_8087/m.24576 type:complete len:201 (-) Transcript_8087:1996-2598(-)